MKTNKIVSCLLSLIIFYSCQVKTVNLEQAAIGEAFLENVLEGNTDSALWYGSDTFKRDVGVEGLAIIMDTLTPYVAKFGTDIRVQKTNNEQSLSDGGSKIYMYRFEKDDPVKPSVLLSAAFMPAQPDKVVGLSLYFEGSSLIYED